MEDGKNIDNYEERLGLHVIRDTISRTIVRNLWSEVYLKDNVKLQREFTEKNKKSFNEKLYEGIKFLKKL